MAYSNLGSKPTLISHNIKGLNSPEKLTLFLSEIKKAKPSLVFLQETQFKDKFIPKLHDKHYPVVYHSSNPSQQTKGVSILIHKNSDLILSHQLKDPNGGFLFLKGT